MIESFYLKEHFSFNEESLKFTQGLVVFSGPSGSGKSLFFNALLSVFGLASCEASVLEAVIDESINLDDFGLTSEELTIFKCIKQKSMRYFINSQNISQKIAKQISQSFIGYLSLRDTHEFDNASLISLLDAYAAKADPSHNKKIDIYAKSYAKFIEVKKALEAIEAQEAKINELKEFAAFEINKIEAINPNVGEDEELMDFKRLLSKKEKIEEAVALANIIFESESAVNNALHLIGKTSELFDESMNYLREAFESELQKLNELDDTNIEAILDRIEQISSLKSRFGTIEEILAHLEKRKAELAHYENISFEKKTLSAEYASAGRELELAANALSKAREKEIKPLTNLINSYLEKLYLKSCVLNIKAVEAYALGTFEMSAELDGVEIKKISSGEFNRLRLAFIAAANEIKNAEGGVLILDEVDSNLSGKESMSVANVLKEISKNYQIFAISHHPQLSSCANQHFIVQKKDDASFIKELDENGRVEELSRMISGENITDKARDFAETLRKENV